VSLEIPQGKVLGIIGNNGAGKSTLLKVLSRITEPTSGRVRINGRIASLLEVGTGFHPELTGRENIFLNGAILGMSRVETKRKFDEIVTFAGVEKFLDTPVKRYSSGMYVRLAFSVAAHLEPEILVIDEVLAVGDFEFQQRCLGKMQDVAHSGRTVLFVSHQLNAIRQLCQSCCLLSRGRIVTSGNTVDVISEYLKSASAINTQADVSNKIYEQPLPLEFIRSEIINHRNEASRHVPFGQPWKIRAEFKLFEDIPDLVAALGIRSGSGQAIQTCWSDPTMSKRGKYEATFTQNQVHLAANSYQLLLGLSRKNRPILQVELGHFDILQSDEPSACGYVASTSGVGLILNSMRSEVSRIS